MASAEEEEGEGPTGSLEERLEVLTGLMQQQTERVEPLSSLIATRRFEPKASVTSQAIEGRVNPGATRSGVESPKDFRT